jgi:heme O synthase-like polyprenyltransferase
MSFASEIGGTHIASHASFAPAFGRWRDFIALTKPRVMSLAVFTALVGLVLAPEPPDPLTGLVAILRIAAGAGAAGALNMWYDADIDAVMARTALRPIPRGRLSRGEALCFGLVLAAGAILILALAANVASAALLAATILFYVIVYTMWLARQELFMLWFSGLSGAAMIALAIRLDRSLYLDARPARRVFAFRSFICSSCSRRCLSMRR